MDLSSDESRVRKEASKLSQRAPLSLQKRPDEPLEVDLSSSSSSNSQSRSGNSALDVNNVSKTASVSSPKNVDCSNKSDLTETSSLRNCASVKNEDQVESSLQGAQATVLACIGQPRDGGNKGAASQRHVDKEQCSVQATTAEDNDGSRASEEEVNICDICGVLGREKLLAVCSICGVGAEHIYCMRVKPNGVPDNWICEDCVSAEKGRKQNEGIERKDEPTNTTTRRELQCGNGGTLDHVRGLDSKYEKRVSMMNGKAKAGSGISPEMCENASKTPSDDQGRSSRKRKAVKPRDCSVEKSIKAKIVSARVSLQELRKRPAGYAAVGVNSTNAGLSSTQNERIPLYKQSSSHGVNHLRDDNPTMSYNPFNGANCLDGAAPQFHVFPLPYCIWQGRFKVQRNGVFSSFSDGLQAHLSRSAAQNASKLAPAFSREILLEETPRSAVWTSQFASNRAAAKNIHIYFFAKDPEMHELSYKSLLQHMIAYDVCLRGMIGGFELLIFSSDKLEDGFQRWNGLSFLWGVFREPKPLSFSSAELNSAQIPRVPIESKLVSFFQMAGRTCQERPNGSHCESAAPNLELSLGIGGASGSSSSRNFHGKEPSVHVSSSNFRGKEPLLSLSLSPLQPLLGGEADSERPCVDTTLSLFSYSR